VLGDPDLGQLTPPTTCGASPQQCAFGQIHTRDMVTITADPAT